MNEKFEFHVKAIIQRLTKQVIYSTIIFSLLLIGGILSLSYQQNEIAAVIFIFVLSFFVLIIIDIIFINTNKKALKEYKNNEEIIVKRLERQYRMYTARNKGISKYLFRYMYKTILEHYELALDAINIEKSIKL